jgi:hypothetical protein
MGNRGVFLTSPGSTSRSHLDRHAHPAADEHGRSQYPDDGANPATVANCGAQPASAYCHRVAADRGPDPNTRTTNTDSASAN